MNNENKWRKWALKMEQRKGPKTKALEKMKVGSGTSHYSGKKYKHE